MPKAPRSLRAQKPQQTFCQAWESLQQLAALKQDREVAVKGAVRQENSARQVLRDRGVHIPRPLILRRR